MPKREIHNIFGSLPVLDTPRLTLRALSLDDLDAVWAYGSDAPVSRYTMFDQHRSKDDTRAFLQSQLDNAAKGEANSWGIVLKDSGKLIGSIGFHGAHPLHARGEIGYAMAQPYWGKGLMTEAVRAVVRCGFEQINLNRIFAGCIPEHTASRRVLEKCGFTCEGILRQNAFFKNAYQDIAMYSLLREEWERMR